MNFEEVSPRTPDHAIDFDSPDMLTYLLRMIFNFADLKCEESGYQLPEGHLQLSPLQLFFKIFHISAESWPKPVTRFDSNRERLNDHLCAMFEIIKDNLLEELTSLSLNQWQGDHEQWLKNMLNATFDLSLT